MLLKHASINTLLGTLWECFGGSLVRCCCEEIVMKGLQSTKCALPSVSKTLLSGIYVCHGFVFGTFSSAIVAGHSLQ
jgi:hypothetical protein